uniref:hypothetical protein n=1 Tax=Salmonella sp. s39606 TaxID=3159643 RepID=UPI0039806600
IQNRNVEVSVYFDFLFSREVVMLLHQRQEGESRQEFIAKLCLSRLRVTLICVFGQLAMG